MSRRLALTNRSVDSACRWGTANLTVLRGYSSVGRALDWQSRGQGFESPYLHSKNAGQALAGAWRPTHGIPIHVRFWFGLVRFWFDLLPEVAAAGRR